MALPLTSLNAKEAFDRLQALATNVKNLCAQVSGPSSVAANMLASLLSQVNAMVAYAQSVQADTALSANLVAFIQSITGSTTVQTDFAASLTAAQALQAAIIKDYPVDSAGHVLDRVIDASGNITWANFTPAQLPNTLPAITAWLATV